MVKIDESKIFHRAIYKWGADMQMMVAIEEMSELTKELIKHQRTGTNFQEIAEEIADVEIMLIQLKIIFGNEDKVEEFIEKKMNRLKEILDGN